MMACSANSVSTGDRCGDHTSNMGQRTIFIMSCYFPVGELPLCSSRLGVGMSNTPRVASLLSIRQDSLATAQFGRT